MGNYKLLELAISSAIEAGKGILNVYNNEDYSVSFKEDYSPLTTADLISNSIIMDSLSESEIHILSEENSCIDYKDRKNWKEFWLIDPLDGTKEFIKRNGEFTVNIALIKDQLPVMGVIYVPVTGELFYGFQKIGSFKVRTIHKFTTLNQISETAKRLPIEIADKPFIIAASRSHMNQETQEYVNGKIKMHGVHRLISRGSSLKLCMVAEGTADVYPRFAPTMEWDTAAGHAIAKFAGKRVWNPDSGEELTYNKRNLLNPSFIVE